MSSSVETSYYLTRVCLLRGLGFIYFVAFLVALHQNKALIGDDGITPAKYVLDSAEERGVYRYQQLIEWRERFQKTSPLLWLRAFGSKGSRLQQSVEQWWQCKDRGNRPIISLLWFAKDRFKINPVLDGIAITGLILSSILFFCGAGNVPILFILWVCQHSLMSVGGPWYGFGWEPQLAELTFHLLFLVPLWSFAKNTPVPPVALWTIRWYLFRIMIGAGLIKIKSHDAKWRDLTAMNVFYETQPIPNLLTRTFHFLPQTWHKFEVLTNHFVELLAPWLLLMPFRKCLLAGGIIQILFQFILILGGNLSFLNWLTMVPAIACLDDEFLCSLLPSFRSSSVHNIPPLKLSPPRKIIHILFGFLILKLSIPVVKNLCAKRQMMNGSFDPLRLVNTYGAFGTVSEDRVELIVESAVSWEGPWKEYEFKVKPGDCYRYPVWITPYHYRLDWVTWIAQFGSIENHPWMFNFLLKLLDGDPKVIRLLDSRKGGDPWRVVSDNSSSNDKKKEKVEGEEEECLLGRPKYIRIRKFKYSFVHPNDDNVELDSKGKRPFWKRELIGNHFPRRGIADRALLEQYVEQTRY